MQLKWLQRRTPLAAIESGNLGGNLTLERSAWQTNFVLEANVRGHKTQRCTRFLWNTVFALLALLARVALVAPVAF